MLTDAWFFKRVRECLGDWRQVSPPLPSPKVRKNPNQVAKSNCPVLIQEYGAGSC